MFFLSQEWQNKPQVLDKNWIPMKWACLIPVNGQWSQWTPDQPCSMECGGGIQTRSRTCTEPAPANDGLDCEGEATDCQTCGTDPCGKNCPKIIPGLQGFFFLVAYSSIFIITWINKYILNKGPFILGRCSSSNQA